MEGFPSGAVSTIPRPQLPPLPAATRAVRGVPDPFRGPVASSRVEGLAPPPGFAEPASMVTGIARPELPPIPPPLKPLAVAHKSEAVAVDEAKRLRIEALRTARVDNGAGPYGRDGVPRPETPAAILALEEQKFSGKSSSKFAKFGGRKPSKTSNKSNGSIKGSGSSNPLQVVGLCVGMVLIVALGLLVTGQFGQGTSVSDLTAGECIESFFDRSSDGTLLEVSSLATVGCAQPHAYEVFAVSNAVFPDAQYPGVDAAFAAGEQYCLSEYEAFIGGDRSNLRTWEVWTFVPPESSWDGARLVQCVVGDINQQELVTGSLRGVAG